MLRIRKGGNMSQKKFYNFVSNIIAYESGELNNSDILILFSELIKGKMICNLQGCYQRTAQRLIEAGYLSGAGEILKDIDE
jgi:hypothetical protein